MRIIAGQARGRRLAVPPGRGTRPSSDRMREALFSSLISSVGSLEGCRFLDLYAGSAAIAIEAWSRGAAHVLAVESDQRAAAVAKRNVSAVGATGVVAVRAESVERLAYERPTGPYDIVFADPPYDLGADRVAAALTGLCRQGWYGDDGLVVVERVSRGPEFAWPAFVVPLRSRAYGEGTLWYGRVRQQGE